MMHQHIQGLRMTSTMIPSIGPSWLLSKPKGLCDVADPDFGPYDGDKYDQQHIEEKQSLVYSVLVTSIQKEIGRELVM